MFNSLSKRFKVEQHQPKPQDNQEMEGFICPMCMAKFSSPDLVQKHFDDTHNDIEVKENDKSIKPNILSPATERKESIQNIQENFNDLKQSLDEEIWFNKELQKECERLNKLLLEKEEEKNLVIENSRLSFEDLEKTRDALIEKLEKVQISRDSLANENNTLRSDFHVCEDKLSDQIENQSKLQKLIEKQKQDLNLVTEQLSSVSSHNIQTAEFQHKYDATLNSVQELSNEIERIKNESKLEHAELIEKCSMLNKVLSDYETEKANMVDAHSHLVSKLNNQLEALQQENQRMHDSFQSTEDQILLMKRSWNTDQITLENTLDKLNEVETEKQKVKLQFQDLSIKIKNRDSELMHLNNNISIKEDEIKNLQKVNKIISDKIENIEKLLEAEKNEKIILQSQVEMTDAANIVMEQLQSEKKVLQDNIINLKKQIESEAEQKDIEISTLKSEFQSSKEQIFDLNLAISEKEEKVQEYEKIFTENMNNILKLTKRLEIENSDRNQLEDKILTLERDLKSKDESLNTFHINFNVLKDDNEKLLNKFEHAEEKFKNQLFDLNNQLNIAKMDSSKFELLKKEVEAKESKIQSLNIDLKDKNCEFENVKCEMAELLNQKEKTQAENESNVLLIANLKDNIDEQNAKNSHQAQCIIENELRIKQFSEQNIINENTISELSNELSFLKNRVSELENEKKESENTITELNEFINDIESKKKTILEEQSLLTKEMDLIKKNFFENEESNTNLKKEKQLMENQLLAIQETLKVSKENYESLKMENDKMNNELFICKSQVDNAQELYEDSMKSQNEYQQKLDKVTLEYDNTKKRLREIEEKYSYLQTELELFKKEEGHLKNKVSALTKTLNESSENYKQERLEAAEKEFSLISSCEELKTELASLTKSLHRTEEDLETEKNLRESERNNMTEKISQLSEKIIVVENVRIECEQKLEIIETENIENKLRLELANEEKEKLLEKIIQLENSLKKQTDLYSKKCKEFDQLQSAILDLGRENQSLQISKEKLTNRQWIGDLDAIECFTCHKPFSLTLRKHHCRNCGQVYCQDCSSKSASLAVSRKPVRVCDGCFIEVQSQRRNSSVSSSNMSLQM